MKFATNPSSHSRSPVLTNLVAALLADKTTAQAIQLYTEYDPQPPFDSGSMAKASPEVLQRTGTMGLASPEVLQRARALG